MFSDRGSRRVYRLLRSLGPLRGSQVEGPSNRIRAQLRARHSVRSGPARWVLRPGGPLAMPGAYNALGFPLLTIMLFIPAAGGVVCWALEGERQVRIVAALTVVLEFALAMFLLGEFE